MKSKEEKAAEVFDVLTDGPRNSGRTTRLADHYIQELFSKGSVIIEDHFLTQKSHERLYEIILTRLRLEHGGTEIFADKGKCKISLKFIVGIKP